jgi:hypothetical protein
MRKIEQQCRWNTFEKEHHLSENMSSPTTTTTTTATAQACSSPTHSISSFRNICNNKSFEKTIPSPAAVVVVVSSDSSSVTNEQHHHPQHDDSSPQETSFSLDDLSKFSCQLARKIDWITRCNNPFEVLRSLGLHSRMERQQQQDQSAVMDGDDYEQRIFVLEGEDNQELDNTNPYVAFQFLKHCEYCGASSTDKCNPKTCSRPSTYFPKQRPPFCQPDSKKWNDDDDDTMIIHRLEDQQPRRRPKRPPIRYMDEWKIVATPKVKNQWVTPSTTLIHEGISTSNIDTTTTRLQSPTVQDDEISIKWTSSSSRSVASTNSSHQLQQQQHPSFFPVSTRELRQRPQQSLSSPVLQGEFKN